jgi:hypothetical protein
MRIPSTKTCSVSSSFFGTPQIEVSIATSTDSEVIDVSAVDKNIGKSKQIWHHKFQGLPFDGRTKACGPRRMKPRALVLILPAMSTGLEFATG